MSNQCFSSIFHFYTLWKRQKTSGFQTFSEGIEMEHWLGMIYRSTIIATSKQPNIYYEIKLVRYLTSIRRKLSKHSWIIWKQF